MSGLKDEEVADSAKGPVYTISSSSTSSCTIIDELSSPCNISASGSNNINECNSLPENSTVIDMNLNENDTIVSQSNNSIKTTKNHVKFNLEASYSENVYLKPYCNYSEKRYPKNSSFKENLKTLCQTCLEFMKKAGKWCCLIFVILGLILFFCLKMDFHK